MSSNLGKVPLEPRKACEALPMAKPLLASSPMVGSPPRSPPTANSRPTPTFRRAMSSQLTRSKSGAPWISTNGPSDIVRANVKPVTRGRAAQVARRRRELIVDDLFRTIAAGPTIGKR